MERYFFMMIVDTFEKSVLNCYVDICNVIEGRGLNNQCFTAVGVGCKISHDH